MNCLLVLSNGYWYNFLVIKVENNFLAIKVARYIREAKDWVNKNFSWSDTTLFNNFKILVGILFGPSLFSRFKEEIIFNTISISYK